MKRLRKFNESGETNQTLRDLIGDVKETKKVGYYPITETTKGCFTNLEIVDYEKKNWLDAIVEVYKYGSTTEVFLHHSESKYGRRLYAYFEGDVPKILSTYRGDERGSCLFGDTFIASGHDGNYLWNIKTGEFKSNTW